MTDRRYIHGNEQAKLLRAVLKESFPGIKFSVRQSRGSGIDVSWTDGAPEPVVRKIAGALDGTYFDSSIDYQGSVYHTLDGEPVNFLGSVSCQRNVSDEQRAAFAKRWAELSLSRRERLLQERQLAAYYRASDADGYYGVMNGWDFYNREPQPSPTLARIVCTGSDAYGCSQTALAIDAAAKGKEPDPEQPPEGYRIGYATGHGYQFIRSDWSEGGWHDTRGEAIVAAREDAERQVEPEPGEIKAGDIIPKGTSNLGYTAIVAEHVHGDGSVTLVAKPAVWTYGLSFRPAGYGTVPEGRIVTNPERTPRFFYGTVSYDRELTVYECNTYQLQIVSGPSVEPPTDPEPPKGGEPVAAFEIAAEPAPEVDFLAGAWGSDGAASLLGNNVVAFPSREPETTITLVRAEGLSGECDKPETVHSFAAANAVLRRWSETAPGPRGGYHKCDFTLEAPALGWKEPYSGRFDLHHWSVEEPDLRAHIRDFWTFYLGDRCPGHMTVEQYRVVLAECGVDEQTKAEVRQLLAVMERAA